MSEPIVHNFKHHAMATLFQVRIADVDRTYAEQAAHEAFQLCDRLESNLSRFKANSEIARIAELAVGQKLRLTEPVFACLEVARRMEFATRGAFSVTAKALQTQPTKPLWLLVDGEFSIRCDSGRLELDLGAIGKGFALDRMSELLREWDCPAFMLVAGGSSILAGKAPSGCDGWLCGISEEQSPERFRLVDASLSGSGLTVKGRHIMDPRTGLPAARQQCAWALTDTAAESDALSTAAMVLDPVELEAVLERNPQWRVFLEEQGGAKSLGNRPLPLRC